MKESCPVSIGTALDTAALSGDAGAVGPAFMLETADVRTEPDPGAEIIDQLGEGEPVEVHDVTGGWSLVSFGDVQRDGYVPSYAVSDGDGGREDARADESVHVEDFEEPLAHYGTWIDDPTHGRIWQPAPDIAGDGFTPYASDGTWEATDDGGWVFRSRWDDAFGWATYHYGRWVDHPRWGWGWLPGTTWAPAWVEWRHGGGHVGWAPLGPPGAELPERRWIFVGERHFGDPGGVWQHRVPPERIHEVFVAARPVAHGRGRLWSPGPPIAALRAAGAPVRVVTAAVPSGAAIRAHAAAVTAHAVAVGRALPPRTGTASAVVRRGPNAGTTVTVTARPPAPVASVRPGAPHPGAVVPHPLPHPHGGAQASSPLAPSPLAPSPQPARSGPPAASRPPAAVPHPLPLPRGGAQGARPSGGRDTGEPPSFEGGTVISLWMPHELRWVDIARANPAILGREVAAFAAQQASRVDPGTVFVQAIHRDPAQRGVDLFVARNGSAQREWFPAGAEPHWPRWTRAAGIAPLPRPNRYGPGEGFADGVVLGVWSPEGGVWNDVLEVPRHGLRLIDALAEEAIGAVARSWGRLTRGRVVHRAAGKVALYTCEPGAACTVRWVPLGDPGVASSETAAPGESGALTDAPIGIAPTTALEQLLAQLDRRFPFRGKGPRDGIADSVLRITDDPGRIGARRSGPNLKLLARALVADPRTLRMQRMSDDRANYLAVVVRPGRLGDVAMWDLSGLSDVNGEDVGGPDARAGALGPSRFRWQLVDPTWRPYQGHARPFRSGDEATNPWLKDHPGANPPDLVLFDVTGDYGVAWYYDRAQPWRGAYDSESTGSDPLITPIGWDAQRGPAPVGCPIDALDWSRGILVNVHGKWWVDDGTRRRPVNEVLAEMNAGRGGETGWPDTRASALSGVGGTK